MVGEGGDEGADPRGRGGARRIEELRPKNGCASTAERLRGAYRFRRGRFAARFDDADDGAIEERSVAYQRLRRELLDAERAMLDELRRQGVITEQVMHRVERGPRPGGSQARRVVRAGPAHAYVCMRAGVATRAGRAGRRRRSCGSVGSGHCTTSAPHRRTRRARPGRRRTVMATLPNQPEDEEERREHDAPEAELRRARPRPARSSTFQASQKSSGPNEDRGEERRERRSGRLPPAMSAPIPSARRTRGTPLLTGTSRGRTRRGALDCSWSNPTQFARFDSANQKRHAMRRTLMTLFFVVIGGAALAAPVAAQVDRGKRRRRRPRNGRADRHGQHRQVAERTGPGHVSDRQRAGLLLRVRGASCSSGGECRARRRSDRRRLQPEPDRAHLDDRGRRRRARRCGRRRHRLQPIRPRQLPCVPAADDPGDLGQLRDSHGPTVPSGGPDRRPDLSISPPTAQPSGLERT